MFSETLKALRQEKKLTQNEVAQACGVSTQCISSLEMGTRSPSGITLSALADFFNVSTDYLLGRTDELGGVLMPPTHAGASDLSPEERKLVEDYRGLGKPLKDLLQSMIKTWQSDELPASSLSPRKKA